MEKLKTFDDLLKENLKLRRTVANLRRKQRRLYKTIAELENTVKGQKNANKDRYKNRRR